MNKTKKRNNTRQSKHAYIYKNTRKYQKGGAKNNNNVFKQIQEDIIKKQRQKYKEIAKLEYELRHVEYELRRTRKKSEAYNNLINKQFEFESDLNIAMRELDNLTQQTNMISNKPDILKEVKDRNDIIKKKKDIAKRSAEKLAEELKMEERQKIIEKRETEISELVHKVTQIPSDKYDKTKMIERIDTLIKYAKGDKAIEMLEETKQIINGERDDISTFKQKFRDLGFYETMINAPTPTIVPIKNVQPQTKPTNPITAAPVIISTSPPTTPTTTRLNWQNINDPTTNYLNQITKGTVGNSEPIIKYNQDIINSKREKIIAEKKIKRETEERIRAARLKAANESNESNASKATKATKVKKLVRSSSNI